MMQRCNIVDYAYFDANSLLRNFHEARVAQPIISPENPGTTVVIIGHWTSWPENAGYCNDPAGNAGKPVLRMVTQMLVWGQCVHRSWHAIQCVWNVGEFSPYVEVPTSDTGGQVWCQMSNRSSVCQQGTQKVMCFIYLHCVSRFRYSCGYATVIERPQPGRQMTKKLN